MPLSKTVWVSSPSFLHGVFSLSNNLLTLLHAKQSLWNVYHSLITCDISEKCTQNDEESTTLTWLGSIAQTAWFTNNLKCTDNDYKYCGITVL